MTKRVNPLDISVSQDSEGYKLYTFYESIQPPMTNHPITPSLELVYQWADMLSSRSDHAVFNLAAQWGADQQLKLDAEQIAQAYQKGADQELDACCEWLVRNYNYPEAGNPLRAARRPKPPSLKEQALDALEQLLRDPEAGELTSAPDTIRRAIEALPND